MASGFPLVVNNIQIPSSEALYQACRFPHLPDVQKKIIGERSPMTAKMVGKPHRNNSRVDWPDTRIKIMRWCLRVKLAQNFVQFGKLLESTFDRSIVEDSTKDDFWGAIRSKQDKNILTGTNALGRLLMELRQFYNEKRYSYENFVVEPLNIPDFNLYGYPILYIDERENFVSYIKNEIKYYEIEVAKTIPIKEETSFDPDIKKMKVKPKISLEIPSSKDEINDIKKGKSKVSKTKKDESQTKLSF